MGIAKFLINDLSARRHTDQHNVVGIQGPPGVGKSTLGLTISLSLQTDFPLSNVHYNRDDWKEIVNAEKGQIFLLDEGANVAMNRTWQSRDQVKLMQILNMIRQRNHTLIWATPNLARLDIVVREDLLTHKLNCFKTGKGRVLTPRFNREGEREGWKLWPGILGWGSLESHPIWGPYTSAKADNFKQATVSMDIVEKLGNPYGERSGILEEDASDIGDKPLRQARRDPLQRELQKQKRRNPVAGQ